MPRNNDSNETTKDHNLTEVKKVIREVAGEVISLNAQKAEIQAQITEARAKVKAHGIKMNDFNTALRLYELEDEDRRDSLTNIAIAFEALGIGTQGDLFPAAGENDDDPRPGFLKGKTESKEPADAEA